jgi:hypothetical protein
MKLKRTGSFCKKAQIVKPTNLIIYTEREGKISKNHFSMCPRFFRSACMHLYFPHSFQLYYGGKKCMCLSAVVLGQPREASWRQTNITRKLLWSVEITSRGAEIEKRRGKKDATLSSLTKAWKTH